MKRVGLVSFMHESNTFNTLSTTREMFEILFGSDIIKEWSEAQHEIGGMIERSEDLGIQLVPLISAYAEPLGPVPREDYELILNEVLLRISNEALDGILLSLHGAMVAEHVRDADGLTLERVRQTVGTSLPVIVTLDLHANISQKMVSHSTGMIIYRTNPHLDQRARGREAASVIFDIIEGKTRPVQAVEKPPNVISILAQNTDAEPWPTIYRQMEALLQNPGIISAGIALGYPYADVEEMGPAVVVVADGDERLAQISARSLAEEIWNSRERLVFSGTSVAEAVQDALADVNGPITLLDVGDNLGGGSPGDGTILFDAILKMGIHNALIILYDPEAVLHCVTTGVGQRITVEVGGKSDTQHGRPITVSGHVRSLHDGYFAEPRPRHGGKFHCNQGVTAVLETEDQHTIVLNSLRITPFSLEQLTSLGIKPELKRILIAKGAVAPRAAYEPISTKIIEVDTPGITAANPKSFCYRNLPQPMFPFEPSTRYPLDIL